MNNLLFLVALTSCASVGTSRDARAQTANEVETSAVVREHVDAAGANDIKEVKARVRALRAEYERLHTKDPELEAQLADLEARANALDSKRGPNVARPSLWEHLAMYGLSLLLAAIASRGEWRQRR